MELTVASLKRKSRMFDLQGVFHLDLSDAGLRRLDPCLCQCSNLKILILARNGLSSLRGMEPAASFPSLPNPLDVLQGPSYDETRRKACFARLRTLDLSQNRLSALDAFPETLPSLTKLQLEGNLIRDVEALQRVARAAPRLTHLSLRSTKDHLSNPLCEQRGYRSEMQRMFPALRVLDGERLVASQPIVELERELFAPAHTATTIGEEEEVEDWLQGKCFFEDAPPEPKAAQTEQAIRDNMSSCLDVVAQAQDLISVAEDLVSESDDAVARRRRKREAD